jgi:stage V sporulation protein R
MDDPELRELEKAMERIWDLAHAMGLDPYPVHFEMVPASIMYEFGAYGLPGRFHHWSHGKAYYRMKMQYDYGLSKIYEMVINTNPSYAFLMENNALVQQKLVVAHVLGHCDFFKHNAYFQHSNRSMVETASLNAERIRQYEFQHGTHVVEEFLDAVLSIQEHIDPHMNFRRRAISAAPESPTEPLTSAYDDLWSLGQEARQERERLALETERRRRAPPRIPPEPEKDLLLFLLEYGPELEPWQRDVIAIVHSEMLYFVPQMQTKVINEGWASFWHARILRELELTDEEFTEFANLNAGVVSPHRRSINPYHLGLKLLEDIERRWDNPTEEEQVKLGRTPGQGRAKLFEVRELENDVSLIRNFLTKELVEELDLYLYERQGNEWVIMEKDWEKVRDGIVGEMTNFGNPVILVEDADYRRNRELYMKHSYEGRPLDMPYAEKTLQYIYRLWGRPVHIETVIDDDPTLISYDGQKITRAAL